MTATTRTSDKSLTATEDKSLANTVDGKTAQVPSRASVDPGVESTSGADLSASDTASQEDGRVRVRFLFHHGPKNPGNHDTLPVAEANDLIAANVAVLDPK